VLSDQRQGELLLAVDEREAVGLELAVAGGTSSELLTLRDELEDPFLQDEHTLSARTAALGGDPCS
jgi:hypothetical protein